MILVIQSYRTSDDQRSLRHCRHISLSLPLYLPPLYKAHTYTSNFVVEGCRGLICVDERLPSPLYSDSMKLSNLYAHLPNQENTITSTLKNHRKLVIFFGNVTGDYHQTVLLQCSFIQNLVVWVSWYTCNYDHIQHVHLTKLLRVHPVYVFTI